MKHPRIISRLTSTFALFALLAAPGCYGGGDEVSTLAQGVGICPASAPAALRTFTCDYGITRWNVQASVTGREGEERARGCDFMCECNFTLTSAPPSCAPGVEPEGDYARSQCEGEVRHDEMIERRSIEALNLTWQQGLRHCEEEGRRMHTRCFEACQAHGRQASGENALDGGAALRTSGTMVCCMPSAPASETTPEGVGEEAPRTSAYTPNLR